MTVAAIAAARADTMIAANPGVLRKPRAMGHVPRKFIKN